MPLQEQAVIVTGARSAIAREAALTLAMASANASLAASPVIVAGRFAI